MPMVAMMVISWYVLIFYVYRLTNLIIPFMNTFYGGKKASKHR